MINNRFRYDWNCWLAAVALFSAASCSPEKNPGGTEDYSAISGSGGTLPVVDIDAGINSQVPRAGSGGQGRIPIREASIDAFACEAVSSEGENVEIEVQVPVSELQPVALYIMLDASWSMVEGLPLPKWQYAFDAIQAFVNDPESNWVSVTIQIFPLPGTISAIDCSGAGYDVPAVPMGALPGNASAITSYLSTAAPIGIGTPIEAALNGAVNYCSAFKQDTSANPEGLNCVVVFVSDGAPNGCSGNFELISEIAGAAYTNNGVRTFAIGMQGADFDLLNMIGQKGEGDCTPSDSNTWACDVTAGSNFLEALELIRDTVIRMETKIETRTQVVDCEWVIPEPPEGQSFDRDMVNFQITSGVNGDTRLVPRVDSADRCASVSEGWHYDNMEEPTRIIVCPQTCEVVRAAEQARIDILLGCESVVIE
jgi:hypothetical protein